MNGSLNDSSRPKCVHGVLVAAPGLYGLLSTLLADGLVMTTSFVYPGLPD